MIEFVSCIFRAGSRGTRFARVTSSSVGGKGGDFIDWRRARSIFESVELTTEG